MRLRPRRSAGKRPSTRRTLRVLVIGLLVRAIIAAVLIFRLTWSVLRTLGLRAALGLAAGLAGLPVH
jgi:hypothetical protein